MTAVRRAPGLLAGLAALAALAAAAYTVTHRPDRVPALGPARPAAAPETRVRTATPPVRSAPAGAGPQVSPAWVTTYAARTGIPARALTAYADASLRAPCDVGWTTLAGIGWVESGHGTTGGQQLASDGRPLVPILGPLLDGHRTVAAVPDGRGGWSRAEGPMQFLPSTWRRWGSDGDGDGVADPQDLDDAAYAAARYLCASGQDLATGADWVAAVRSYNHSDDYVRAVYAAATAYAERSS